jgi:Etoposide-induced protein 2.4 (EI24)
LHPRVIALSILPLVIMSAAALALGFFFWDAAMEAVRNRLEGYELVNTMLGWLERVGLHGLRVVLVPLIVLFLSIPVIVICALLFVAWMMTPAMVSLVAERRFHALERKRGGSLLTSVVWSLGSTLLAVIALGVSMPLWFIPPLVLILPPLIWGWLTYRVMAYDALVDLASREERRQIFREHRTPLLAIGVVSGYLGAAPSVLWASGAMFMVFAPILVPLAIWIYTLVFAFSSLWYAHYTLDALARIREKNAVSGPVNSAQTVAENVAIDNPSVPALLPPLPQSPPDAPRPLPPP